MSILLDGIGQEKMDEAQIPFPLAIGVQNHENIGLLVEAGANVSTADVEEKDVDESSCACRSQPASAAF